MYEISGYFLHITVNGGYSSWSLWGNCSTPCGFGSQFRKRSCSDPVPSGGGKDCSQLGHSEEIRTCYETVCTGINNVVHLYYC